MVFLNLTYDRDEFLLILVKYIKFNIKILWDRNKINIKKDNDFILNEYNFKKAKINFLYLFYFLLIRIFYCKNFQYHTIIKN